MLIDSIRLVHVAQPVAVAEPFGDRQLDRHESVLVELRSGEHSAWGQADPGTAPGDSASGPPERCCASRIGSLPKSSGKT